MKSIDPQGFYKHTDLVKIIIFFISMMKSAINEHNIIILIAGLFLLWLTILQFGLDLNGESVYIIKFTFEFFAIFIIAPFFMTVGSYIVGLDSKKSWKHIPDITREIIEPHNILRYMLCVIAIYIALMCFSPAKSLISVMNPFQYDALISSIDKFLHFGRYPHEYFGFILDNPKYVVFMDWFYISWFYYIYAYMAYVVFQPSHSAGRIRLIACFCLCWVVLGGFVATLASSVGPIFWDHYVSAPNPYATLISTLQTINDNHYPLMCLDIAALLLEWQNDGNIVDLSGPSAMPSIHVAMVALFVFHSWNYNRFFFPLMLVYCLLTMIGSVVLAWHYALDGYVSIILMYIMWKLMGLYRA